MKINVKMRKTKPHVFDDESNTEDMHIACDFIGDAKKAIQSIIMAEISNRLTVDVDGKEYQWEVEVMLFGKTS